MPSGSHDVGKLERRFIGDCPWCGKRGVHIRDYLCYHVLDPCCHELYRALLGKVSIALRAFPNSTINADSQFEDLAREFLKVYEKDRKFKERYQKNMENIEAHMAETHHEMVDFFRFLFRLYIIREQIKVIKQDELVKQFCTICGMKFANVSRTEICQGCIERMGAPSDEFLSVNIEQPAAKKPIRGMHYKK
ncbi:MAG: hypothetical protein GC154_10075 [bacterium]|nr:hypothetical protein [bacterium]